MANDRRDRQHRRGWRPPLRVVVVVGAAVVVATTVQDIDVGLAVLAIIYGLALIVTLWVQRPRP